MLPVIFERSRQPPRFNGFDHLLNLNIRQPLLGLGFDIADIPTTVGHVLRHGRFECGISHEDHYRKHLLITQVQQALQCLNVFVVLVQRVLKFLRVLEDPLCPIPLFGVTEDPALHVLGFHHKHPVLGDDYVVDLGGAVFGGQGNVLDEVVTGFIEKEFGGKVYHPFPGSAFEPGRFDDRRHDKQGNQVPNLGRNVVLEGVQ